MSVEEVFLERQSRNMLSNGPEMSGMRNTQNQGGSVRSQDDATVGYFFQRPQTDVTQQYNSKRWAVGDDSVIEQVACPVLHILPLFALAFQRQLAASGLKLSNQQQRICIFCVQYCT